MAEIATSALSLPFKRHLWPIFCHFATYFGFSLILTKKGLPSFFHPFFWSLYLSNLADHRSSRCYLQVEERINRNRCLKEMGEPVTRSTCCCSVGKAWGSRCELCPPYNSDEYKQLCPGGTGYRPNSVTVTYFFFKDQKWKCLVFVPKA